LIVRFEDIGRIVDHQC